MEKNSRDQDIKKEMTTALNAIKKLMKKERAVLDVGQLETLAAKTEEIKSAFIGSKMLEKICKLMEKYRFSDKANQLAKTIPSESFRQCLQLKFLASKANKL